MLPQVIKTFKEKKADNISAGMLVVLMCGIILWIWYGTIKTDWPIILTNAFSLLINIIMLVLRFIYKDKSSSSKKAA
jgi:MtN3 and saliva related transmembrane protein